MRVLYANSNQGAAMFDTAVTPEVSDRIAEIGRKALPAKPAAYDSPEGKLFRKALALIADERDWCGTGAGLTHLDEGTQRCSVVAIYYASGCDDGCLYASVRDAISRQAGQFIINFNDTHTHAEVIAKWHEAGHANGWL
jgi:hypothetical protein